VVTPKTSYIMPLDGKMFVGCGVYRREAAGAAGATAAAASTPVVSPVRALARPRRKADDAVPA
jgi:hypothetical protein